jgi:hypothetical protein
MEALEILAEWSSIEWEGSVGLGGPDAINNKDGGAGCTSRGQSDV